MDSHEKQSPQRFGRYAAMLIMLLTLGVGQMWAEPWLCRSTNGGNIATKTVGDKLNNGNEWNYTYTTNGGWSSASDIQVLVGISTSSYTSVNAGWVSDDGSNKNVAANIGNVTFDKSGKWYAVGKYKSGSTTAYTTTNNSWTNNTTLAFGSNSEPYWTVNPPAVSGFTVTPSGAGYVSGSGTEEDPYIMNCAGGNLTLTLSGSKATTDANSRLEYKSGTNSWNTTTTRTVNSISATTTAASLTLKMRCYNTSASLSGAESSITIWYKKENSGSVSVSVTPSAGGSASRTPTTMGYYSGGTITATANTGYDFTRWDVTTGSGTIGSATTPSTTFKPSTSSATVRATFTAKTINLTLNGNGGSAGSATVKYDANALTSISHASWAGHSLTGYWTEESGGDKVLEFDGTLSNASGWVTGGYWKKATDGTLYAQWTVDVTNYTVTYAVKSDQTSLGTLSCATTVGSTPISSGGEVESGTGVTFTASPITGYEVDAWCSNEACTSPIAGAGYANTYSTTVSANTAVYVKFKKKIYTITYSPSSAPTGCTYTTKPTTGTYGNTVTMVITPSTGYTVSVSARDASSNVVTISNPSANTYTFTQPASAVTVTVSTSQIMSSLSTSCSYDAGYPSYSAPTKSVSSIGIATTSTVTAASASTGYTFAGWTLTNCTRTDGGGATANPITVRSNGDGAAATVVANYEEDRSSRWHLVGQNDTGYEIFPDGWNVSNTSMMQKASGHATESVVYATVTVSSKKTYEFKIVDDNGVSDDIWYGYSTGGTYLEWTETSTKNVYSGDGNANNLKFTPSLLGTYEFKVDYSGTYPAVTITYPEIYAISGDFNSWTEETNLVFSGNDGSYEVSIDGSSTNYEFKVLDNGSWYGHTNKTFTGTESNVTLTTPNNNIKLTADVYPGGTYTFAYNKSTHKLGVTYPANFVVNFGKRTGGNTVTAKINNVTSFNDGTKIASGTSVTFSQSANSGYTFEGWYNAASGGTRVSTSASYTTTISAATTIYANYTANTYTVSFNINGGSGATPDAITVTYDAPYGALPAGPTPPGAGQFAGWFTESSGGTLVTAETIVSTASNHTLYAQYEDVYSVNVDFKCGGAKIYPSTVVNASPTALRPTITAPEIFGYSFVNWTGDDVTPASATSATTTITATAATTITANYAEVPTVYFKNNLEWDSVFVSFDITWTTAGEKQVPNNSGKPYYAMKQIGTTDIYYCEIPSTYTASNYASWSANIAFDNQNYNHKATTTHTGNMTSFYQGEFTGRGDFDPKATLFIPYNGDTEARNGGTFYKTGCWMKYNSTESGYQLNMNEWVTGEHDDLATPNLTAPTAGGYEFSATVNLSNADYSYGFKLYKQYQKNTTDLWYTNTGTINASTESLPWHFWAGSTITETSQRCELHTEAVGDYKISVSFATGRPMVNVEYPTQVGDWRLAYNDRIAWSGDAHAADWYIYSRVIKAKADAEDLVSFYVSKAVGANAHIELQKCTDINSSTGAETWTKQGDNLNLSSITGTGIYNFKVTQNGSKVATAAYDGAYEGNFYIRTDASDGGWTNYISSGKNVMTYSEYAKDYSGFTHYYMRFVETGTNIKFCIANDYSPCLTEYCIDDDYTGEYIEAKGNVRYMWDHRTNKVSRAYISGSSIVSDRFLVLEGNTMIMAEDGTPLAIAGLNANEKNFADDQNWIYEATIKAKPTARVKLTAKFNNQVQYFKGSEGAFAEGTTVQLIGGTGDDAYKIRVIYDFKTNRLVGAWLPDDETVISSDWPIDADIMVLRYHQEGAKQIKFSGSGALSDVKTVYGAMQFNKYRVNNKRETAPHANLGLSNYERDLYWISFPFEVKLSDVFGFGTYGKHWIIEYYDGKTRAANGFWADSDPNWKFVTPSMRNNGYVLKANQGYVLALDLDNMTEESDVWAYGTENVYLYFPSTAHVSDIDAMDSKTISIDQTGYECTINRGTPDGDRRVKDSYWHVLGVPSYANASHETANAWTGTVPNIDPDNWTSSAPYIYEWVPSTNKYTVHSSSSMTFLPMHSYYAQYAQTTITWTNINATPAALVARRNAARKSNYEFRMEMTLGDEVADQTYVSLRDDEAVTNEFDFSYDLSKITNGSFAKTNCIYTLIGYERAAANCLPLETEATTIVPVGVNIATAGEYTIAIPSGTSGVGVTLVDNETGLRTNLALEDYTVALEAGTQDDRFYLEISPIKHVATDIENVQNDETQNAKARKVIIDQKMYIIKDGRVFDAQGARVK